MVSFGRVLWLALRRFRSEKAERMAAALAYYSVFSLAPLFMLAVSVSTLLVGREAVRGSILEFTAGLLGAQAAEVVEPWLKSAYRPGAGALTSLAGLGAMLFGASRVVLALQESLRAIYGAPRPSSRLRAWVMPRASAAILVLSVLLLLAAAPPLGAALAWLGRYEWAAAVSWLALETMLFFLLLRSVPGSGATRLDVLEAALLTAGLFSGAQSGVAWYLGRFGRTSIYGASASLVALLLWIYIASQIVLFGAALVWARVAERERLRREADARIPRSLPTGPA